MKRSTAEILEGDKRVQFSFDAADDAPLPQQGELSNFQSPEMARFQGQAYVAYSNYRLRFAGALSGHQLEYQVPTPVLVTGWEEV